MASSTIRSRGLLIGAALAVQAVVLTLGWFVTFRIVQRSFATVIEARTIDQNRELARRVASLFPAGAGDGVAFGTDEWERLQGIIESEALRELPEGGFACLIEPDGQLLCHPEIRESPGLRDFSFDGKQLLAGLDGDDMPQSLIGADADSSGVVEFAAGDFHYVATQPLAGSDLRLLVHQPIDALVNAGREGTRWVMGAALVAVVGVLGITGAGLVFLLRRYDSVHEALNRQLKSNLEVARRVQQNTLPRAMPALEGFDLAGWSRPADETGGDTFDVVALGGTDGPACAINPDADAPVLRAGVLLADATGHGIGPALAVTQLHAMTRLAWRLGSSVLDAARFVNEQLAERLPEGRFVTAVFGVVNAPSGELELFSAGQGPLMVYRAGDGSVETLDTETYPLGVMNDLGADQTRRVTLAPGDVFCAVSDGIIEACDETNAQFGSERLSALVRRVVEEPAGAIADRIGDAVDAFTEGAPPDDDRTVLIIKRTV